VIIPAPKSAIQAHANRTAKQIRERVPRQYARGGPVMSGAMVIISSGLPDGFEPPSTSVSLDPPAPYRSWRYYGGSATLDRLIDDPAVDIHDVIREVERLCRGEAHAAAYYRQHPELLGSWHPWLEFVKTGHAAYLGWEKP
jgi:hypothetical protein